MKKIKLCFFALCVFAFFMACKNSSNEGPKSEETADSQISQTSSADTKSNKEEISIDLNKKIDEKEIIEKMVSEKETVNEAAKVENISDTKLEEKSKKELEKEAALKRKIAEEKVAKSTNKGASCVDILKKYEEIADQYLKSRDVKLLVEMNNQNNDVFFAACRKDASFQKSIDAVNAKVDAALEEN